jgi:hypothetical protein
VVWHLRHLPEPVIPGNLYDLVVSMGDLDDDSEANNRDDNPGAYLYFDCVCFGTCSTVL